MIRTDALSRRFGSFCAVKNVTFDVKRGEIFGYLGANGAGKSTTIKMLCGLLMPSSGTAYVDDLDVAKEPERVKRAIGYMSQRFSLYGDLSVEENLEFFGGAYGLFGAALRARIDSLLEAVALREHRQKKTRDLPAGFRQRLALASAQLHVPRVLFLDEPTAGVDPVAREGFWNLIRVLSSSGTTIFVTTHYMDEAEGCDRVGLMVNGELAALDSPRGLKRTYLPGRMFRIAGERGIDFRSRLESTPGIFDVQPFGAALHARSTTLDAADLRALLLPHSVVITEINASLEDVFLKVVSPP